MIACTKSRHYQLTTANTADMNIVDAARIKSVFIFWLKSAEAPDQCLVWPTQGATELGRTLNPEKVIKDSNLHVIISTGKWVTWIQKRTMAFLWRYIF